VTEGRTRLWFAALLVLTLVYFAPVLTTRTFYFRDLSHFYFQTRAFAAETWLHGDVPLWDPFRGGGMPFLADPMNATFDPTLLLYAVMDRVRAFNAGIVLYYLASAIGAWLLARDLGRSAPAAFLTAIIATYSGIALSELDAGMNRHIAASMAPVVLVCIHRLAMTRRPIWLAAAAVAGAIQLFGGAPETVLITWIMGIGWAWSVAPEAVRAVGRTIAAGAVAALLGAVQIIPAAAWMPLANRGARYDLATATFWSLHPNRLPELFVPRFLGAFYRLHTGSYWGSALEEKKLPLMVSLYVGAAVFALAVAGWSSTRLRPRMRGLLFVMVAASFAVAIARYTIYGDALFQYVSLLRAFRYPVKYLALVPLCVAIAAGAGLDALTDDRRALRLGRITLAVCATVAGALWIAHAASSDRFEMFFFRERLAGFARGNLDLSFLLSVAVPLAALAATFVSRLRVPALIALISADLLAGGIFIAITAPRTLFEREPPTIKVVRQLIHGGGLYRHNVDLDIELLSPTDDYVWWDRNAIERFNAQTPRMFVEVPLMFQKPINDVESRFFSTARERILKANWPQREALLSSAGVTLIATIGPIVDPPASLQLVAKGAAGDPPLVIYADTATKAMPRLVHQVTVVRSLDAAAAAIEAGADVLFGEQPGPLTLGKPAPWSQRTLPHGNSTRRWEVEAAAPGFLLLPLPGTPGWHATVDDAPVPFAPANLACSAVPFPAGRHVVKLTYDPPGWYPGLTISVVTALLLALWVAIRARSSEP
jgi:Bacterial membrane protein YfhO